MTGSKVPDDRQYTETHEWVRTDGADLLVGITDHAQAELTDIVFVDLPAVGRKVAARESLLVLESVKTVADVYAPTAGEVRAVNDGLKGHPEWINRDPYGDGWLYRLAPAAPPTGLLAAAAYARQIGESA